MPLRSQFIGKAKGVVSLVLSIILTLTLWACSLPASPRPSLDKNIKQVLSEYLLSKSKNSILQEKPISAVNVRAIVHERLDASLLTNAEKVTGMDYRFVISGQQTETQIATLVLSYPDENTALRMTKVLSKAGSYFKRSEIITPFSGTIIGNQIVIAFTEKAGNDAAVRFIRDFPAYLKEPRY